MSLVAAPGRVIGTGIVVRMLVTCVLSLKGGVGKTTVTLGLASAALHRGLSTVVVDLDPQGNATVSLDVEDSVTVDAVLADPRRSIIRSARTASRWGEHVTVLAGGQDTERHNSPDPGAKRLARLRTGLDKLDPKPDLVLIDCPPSLGQLTRSALVASDRAILVAEPSLYAVAGVQRALQAVQDERVARNPRLQPLGLVINRVHSNWPEHEFRISELRELFGPLVLGTGLPDRSAVQQAEGAATPIHAWPTQGAREVAGYFDTVLDRLLRSAKLPGRKGKKR